jgi:hypothetical protein
MKSLAQGIARLGAKGFGVASLVAGLALLASIPLLNILALGYLLESSGRTARTGRFRDGFPGVRQAAILGLLAVSGWLLTLPVRFASGLWTDAALLGETAPSFRFTRILLAAFTVGMAALILLGLIAAGYLYARNEAPETKGWPRARDGLIALLADLHLPQLFWLGIRGWAGGFVWLLVPIGILYAASRIPHNGALLLAFFGIIALIPVATTLPLAQARFAASGRFGDLFDWGGQRRLFRQAPLASFAAVLSVLVAALPLYLLKIELPPQDVDWLPGLFFILLLWPARILTGWAIHRAGRSDSPRSWPWVWLGKLPLLAAGLAYGVWVWIMQFLNWTGAASFLEQHAFLLPAVR